MDPIPRLACQQCKQRKIRCDKGAPCSACRNAGLGCHAIQRARLPRGRTAKARSANTNIETRIARIERLLEENNKRHAPPLQAGTQAAGRPALKGIALDGSASNNIIDHFVAPDFWKLLSEEVSGLRETLEIGNEDEDSPITEPTPEPDDDASRAGGILFRNSHQIQNASFHLPSLTAQAKLLEIYRYRVESVYKVFHWPTVLKIFEQSSQTTQSPVAVRALQFSIIFMAFCTITNAEAVALDLGDRTEMLQLYRSATEEMLSRSQLLLSPDLITLQAFVIYLNALRTCSSRATTWTLLAVAVRAATALRLGDEIASNASPLDRELRRRLLFAIGILDSHASMDRGTVPMLPLSALHSAPLGINDSELTLAGNLPVQGSEGFTDMTHTELVYAAMLCQRRIYEASLNADSENWAHWPKMLGAVADFKQHVENDHHRLKNVSGPLALLHNVSGPKILAPLQLLLRRPPYGPSRNIVPPWDDMNILDAATTVLEGHTMPMSEDLAPWAWKSWVQWHALAVALAELMVQPTGHLADRAYAAATKSFAQYTTLIADGDSGMLWKPIARLMHRVHRLRQPPAHKILPHNLPVAPAPASHAEDALPQETTGNFGTSPFNNWDLQLDFTNLFTNGEFEIYDKLDNVNAPENTQWLAWDCFLQDLNFPGA